MPIYNCDHCDKEFNNVTHLQDHMFMGIGCSITEKKNIDCDDCGASFTTKKALAYHIKTQHQNETKKEIESLKKTLEIVTNKLSALEKRKPGRPSKIMTHIGNNTNVDSIGVNNISNQQINNQQIIMVEYGGEDISMLTLEEKQAIVNAKYDAIRKCAELLHCNPKKPELRNLSVTNLRSNIGHQYKRGKFRIKSKDGMLEDFARDKAQNVQDILDENKVVISKAARDKLEDLLHLVDKNNDEQMKTLKRELEVLLYEENKTIVM